MAETSRLLAARTLASVVGWARELERADTVVRTPLALSRRVGVVAVEGASGTSTVAAALAGLLARRRRGPVLGVDAGGGGLRAGLGRPSAAASEPHASEPDAGPTLLDLTGPGATWPAPVGRWDAEVAPVSRSYDLVVTDWGTRPWSADLVDVAVTGHVLVVVARADRRAALEAAASLSLLREAGALRPLLALVEVERTPDRLADRLARQLGVPVATIAHDRTLSAGPTLDSRRLPARTRLAYVRLGQAVVEQAALSTQPRRPLDT